MRRWTCALLFSTLPLSAQGEVFDLTAPPGENYRDAEFRLWLPAEMAEARAVMVLVPGSNGDGRGMAEDEGWQAFAQEQHLAVLACRFTDKRHDQMFLEHYVGVSRGSGQALLNALVHFAEETAHPELAAAPLLFWGMSAGGQFNYEMVAWKPERVLAFVVNKGGVYYSALVSKEAQRVPGMLFVGGDDMAYRNWTIAGIFAVNRRAGALWSLVEEPRQGHVVGASLAMGRQFFASALKLRLPHGRSEMQPVPKGAGVVADLETGSTQLAADAEPVAGPTAWFASEDLAQAWQKLREGK